METLEFAVELRKKEEKDKVMENSYARFQIREAVGRSQMFFKIGILKNFLRISQEKSWLQYLFNKVAGMKRSATLLKKDSGTGHFL